MWKVTVVKQPRSSIELKVSIVVNQTAKIDWIRCSTDWIERFDAELEVLKTGNAFKASHSFKATPRNESSLEVWKINGNGEFKHKMWQVDFVKEYVQGFAMAGHLITKR